MADNTYLQKTIIVILTYVYINCDGSLRVLTRQYLQNFILIECNKSVASNKYILTLADMPSINQQAKRII